MMKKIVLKLLGALMMFGVLFVAADALAFTPDSNSPIAAAAHPRMYFVADDYKTTHPAAVGESVSELRTRLDTNYSTELQTYINYLDSRFGDTVTSKGQLDATHETIGFIFLYLIDPALMTNFTFSHTKVEYRDKAIALADYIASNMMAITTWSRTEWNDFGATPHSGPRGPVGVAVSLVYDWANGDLSLSQKQNYADAIIHAYEVNKVGWWNGSEYEPIKLFGSTKHYGQAQNGLGSVVLDGVELDDGVGSSYQDKIQEMFNDAVDRYVLTGAVALYDHIFDGGFSWPEGEGYLSMHHGEQLKVIGALRSAMNRDFYMDTPSIDTFAIYNMYGIDPLMDNNNGAYQYTFADGAPEETLDDGVHYYTPRMHHVIGMATSGNASYGKWFFEDSIYAQNRLESVGVNILYWYPYEHFFSDWKSVTKAAGPPEQKSKRIGNQHFMRSGFNSQNDTLVTFSTPEYVANMGGHSAWGLTGSFRIDKYGHLLTDRGISKSYSGGNIFVSKGTWTKNNIAVVNPSDSGDVFGDMTISDGANALSQMNPANPVWQYDGENNKGKVLVSEMEGSHYDYVKFDKSNAWDDNRVTFDQRELIYLRSEGGTNDEYVVVHDMVDSTESNADKYYNMQAVYLPVVSGSLTEITTHGYPNGVTYAGRNAHGRLYNKTLLPTNNNITISDCWRDYEGDIIQNCAYAQDEEEYNRGRYTIRVKSNNHTQSERFLNVMQFGDSNTLSSMNNTDTIDATTMIGAHIKDTTENRVVMFNSAHSGNVTGTVSYSITTTALARHILTSMQPSTTYEVSINGTSSNISSNDKGTLTFNTAVIGATNINVTEAGSSTNRADVDQNSAINSTDAMLTLRNSLTLDMSSTSWQAGATTGDANCDGSSNSTDVMLIFKYSLGFDVSAEGWCGN